MLCTTNTIGTPGFQLKYLHSSFRDWAETSVIVATLWRKTAQVTALPLAIDTAVPDLVRPIPDRKTHSPEPIFIA